MPERNAAALTSRWNTIRADVSKFCGLFSKVEAEERSGWSPDMYIEETLRLWKLKDPKITDFAFKKCWVYLKGKRKWLVEIGAVSKNQSIDPVQTIEPKTETPTRPKGQKAAKRRARAPEHDLKSLQHAEFMAIAKRKAQALEDRNAFNLFAMDPNSTESQQYFTLKRRALLKALVCQLNENEVSITSTSTSSVGDPVAQPAASSDSLESETCE